MSGRRTAANLALWAAIFALMTADTSNGRANSDVVSDTTVGARADTNVPVKPAAANAPRPGLDSADRGTWASWLGATAMAVGETGQQAASAAYYLGGEVLDSSRIIGLSTLRGFGLIEGPPALGADGTTEDGTVSAWVDLGLGGGPAKSDTGQPVIRKTTGLADGQAQAAMGVAHVDSEKGGSRGAPLVDTHSGESTNELISRVSSTSQSLNPARPAGGSVADLPLPVSCEWSSLSQSATPGLSADDIGTLTGLGLMDESARRLSDGTVFFPVVTQRLLQVRTAVACDGQVASTRRLVGHVIANPTSSGLVQAEQDGRVEKGAFGFPVIGQKVQQGELLAYLSPILSTSERAQLNREIETLRGMVAAKELEIARTREMPLLPFRDGRILSLRLELNTLKSQRDALIEGLDGRQPLVASVSGVIVESQVRVGQVIEARHVLWEIADADDLWVEAEMFDGQPLNVVPGSTAVTSGGLEMGLKFIGAGLSTTESQASPVQFQVTSIPEGVRIGERVVVNLREGGLQSGTLIPKSAMLRRPNGEMVVWSSFGPERFEALKVDWKPVDGSTVLIEAGISPGMRVVVDGASLLSEVR
ncbi:MAG: efflux RND transporter periplasmic adaptor subunit [Alphaproteobacteria bacterium]|nr:efflux RND transporter periplasmic adaptor subunit [Alphaproteobacteria bacterium]